MAVHSGVVMDFLKGLPSQHPENFQKWSLDGPKSNITKKPSTYVPTKDLSQDEQQVIVTDKANIVLRYLHNQYDKKQKGSKRENATLDDESGRKRARIEWHFRLSPLEDDDQDEDRPLNLSTNF